jgi:hypothetical protein
MDDSPSTPVVPELIESTGVRFAGVWRRLAALMVDAMLIGMLGLGLGAVFADRLVRFGTWGRALGFLVAGIYFAVGNSRLTGWQTPGKWLLRLRVRGLGGERLSLPRSALRYAVFALPLFASGVYVDMPGLPASATVALATVSFGLVYIGLLANGYLFLIGGPERRVLHDAAANSVVVHASSDETPIDAAIDGMDWLVVVCVPTLVLSALYLLEKRSVLFTLDLESLRGARVAMLHVPDVTNARVVPLLTSLKDHAPTGLLLTVDVASWPDAPGDLAHSVVAAASGADPELRELDAIVVELHRGFDIGMARGGRAYGESHAPADWLRVPQPAHPPAAALSPAPRAGVAEGSRIEPRLAMQSAMAAAEDMKAAVTEYVAHHKAPPDAAAVQQDPAFRTVRVAGATVRVGPGGSIDMQFGPGPLAEATLSWVPMTHHGEVNWVCAQGKVPVRYLPPACTNPHPPH